MKIEFIAATRDTKGTGASRRLRLAQQIPGILYGADKTPQPIAMAHNALYHLLKREAFHASVLTMNLDGIAQPVLLRDVQMHAYKQQVMHLDFQRVAADQKIHMKVPLHFVNAETSPGVKIQGGVVSHTLNELEVACLPSQLPEFIEVDLQGLSAGHSIHILDLKMPANVEALLHRGENAVVASILLPRGASTAEDTAEDAAAAATPESATGGATKK